MQNDNTLAARLVRMTGFFAIAIGIAWAAQTLGFGEPSLATRLLWTVAASSMCGAGAGLIYAVGMRLEHGAQ